MTVVLDADVLIGALDRSDAHHPRARDLLRDWRERGVQRLISVVNLSEVLVAPAAEPETLSSAREAIAALGVVVHRPSEAIGVEAARLRGRHAISLPDAYCLATATHAGAQIATFDDNVLRAAKAERLR